ncbi:uncharacterized protein TM35_000241300 [Trypanosoma theileri]|uniref:Uncharacterized protein n=1 Tax=Trypanosoma theileri TaxID=67003 RepID=A0A1X0NS83_9TRYP|nr:uncharacterized protein TM35_000241300 [Trypanosoma theileri]ORC86980.1 hypothetical protein TM35_000241300 [Trypanosoma theileri]
MPKMPTAKREKVTPTKGHKQRSDVKKGKPSAKSHPKWQKSQDQQQQHQEQQKQQQSSKNEALRAALANAFSSSHSSGGDADASAVEVDEYGKGCPTDRLQFGYAPAIAAEAVAFHNTISAKKWIDDRRRQGRITIVKKQKLTRPNCEPMTSLLKLKQHWRNTKQFLAEVRGSGSNVAQDAADDLLEMLVSQQRVA